MTHLDAQGYDAAMRPREPDPMHPDAHGDALVATARALPKVLLHEHLDGGLRASTLIELSEARGLSLPSHDAATLAQWFSVRAHAGSLPAYLEGFGLTIPAMANLAALERVAFEAAEDALADGCVLAELRCAPNLWQEAGIATDAAIEALLAGLRRSALPSGLIVCALRQHSPAETAQIARAAVRYRDRGVIGFDLAGPEFGHPPSDHAAAFAIATEAGLPITCHAGEADVGERVIEAARLGARRIGHGVRVADALTRADGQALIDECRSRRLHFEVCVTSNVHTGAVVSRAAHPIRALWDAGIELSAHTDSRLMSGVNASDEAASLVREGRFTWGELALMNWRAAGASFLPEASRREAQTTISAWAAARGEPLPIG